MIKERKRINPSIDRWFFLISGILVVILLTIAVAAIVFLGEHVFQSFSPISDSEQGLKYNLEGYRSLNPSGGSGI